MDDPTTSFSDILDAGLRVRGLSPAELAAATGRDPSEISHYRAGRRVPTAGTLHLIAVVLGWDAATRSRALAAVAAYVPPPVAS